MVYCSTYLLPGNDLFSHWVYSGGGDALIKSWDVRTGDNVLTLQGHTQEVVNITIVSIIFLKLAYFGFNLKLSIKCNKDLIASASSDSTVRIWKADSGK